MFIRFLFLVFLVLICAAGPVMACEFCTIQRIGKEEAFKTESRDGKWFSEFLYEYQRFEEMDAHEAHELHDQGHHFHDKLSMQAFHFMLGRRLNEKVSLQLDLPYVAIRSLEIDSHARLGRKEKSEGLGDLTSIVHYNFLKKENMDWDFVAGMKFPTGETDALTSGRVLFEPELQPGTGSLDYIFGLVYKQNIGRFSVKSNVVYVFKTEGGQDFTYGDVFSTSVLLDYELNPKSDFLKTIVGVDVNLQVEQKQKDNGARVADSGGNTLLLGPAFNIQMTEQGSLFGTVMSPVMQDLGGVHQKLEYMFTAGARFAW